MRLYIENLETESEAKAAALEKDLNKLKVENKILHEKITRTSQSKDLITSRPLSKERLSKPSIEEGNNKLSTNQNTMVGSRMTHQRNYLENFRKTKPNILSANRVEAQQRLSANPNQSKVPTDFAINESQEHLNSLTMRRGKHNAANSISNPQALVEELKSKNRNSFTSSFQRLLTTYKKSKEPHKSTSIGGNQSESALPKNRNAGIFGKHKTAVMGIGSSSTGGTLESKESKKHVKSQKVYSTKKTED